MTGDHEDLANLRSAQKKQVPRHERGTTDLLRELGLARVCRSGPLASGQDDCHGCHRAGHSTARSSAALRTA